MAVTPLSTPLKTEYKPLGLEVFAQPLSDMQAKFDTVKADIEAADFALSRLNQDDPRAQELIKEMESKRNQLAENLMTTGNYRQASSKLKEFNKVYNKDEETNAIKSNYETYQKATKEQKERVAKGEITQKDYDLWDFRVKHSFQGTNYDRNTDSYSNINVHPRMKNMEKELREESLKLAGMAEYQVKDFLDRNQVDAFTQERILTAVKERKLDQVAKEIEQFLKTSDQYKNWVNEDADYKWYYNSNTDPNYSENYLNSVVNQYDERIANYEQYLSDPKMAPQAQAQIDKLEKDRSDLINYANQATDQGALDDFAKSIFMNQAQGRFGATAYAASDIVDMEQISTSVADKTDAGAKGKADNSIKKLQEIGTIGTNLAANAGEKNTTTTSGTSTASTAEYKRDAFTHMKQTTVDDIPDLQNINDNYTTNSGEKEKFSNVANTSKDLHVTLSRLNIYSKDIQELDEKIKLQKDALAHARSPEEKAKLSNELTDMYENKEEKRIAVTDETRTFDNILAAEINANYVTPELKKKYEELYQKDPAEFLRNLRIACNTELEKVSKPGKVLEAERQSNIQQWYLENPDTKLTPEQEEAMFPKNNFYVQPQALKETPEIKLANNIMKAYRWNLASEFTAIGQEIIMNDSMNAMSDGAAKEIVDYVSQNTRGKSDVKKVSYNILTGQSKEDSKGNRFDLAAYNAVPHFSGTDKNGDIVLRYVLKSDYDPETASSKSAIANYIKTEKGLTESDTYNPTAAEVTAWREANPTDLYIAVKGRTKQLTDNAEKNYAEIAKAGIVYNDGTVINQNLNNYAPIHMAANAERKEAYYKMAARLKDAVDNNHKYTELVQAPAAWNDNGNGTYTGYQIVYKVVDGQIIAQVNEGILSAKTGKTNWQDVAVKNLTQEFNNLPTALVAMDLTYGTGREEDLVYTQEGFNTTVFVPAFKNPGVATQGGTSEPFRRYDSRTGKWVQH